MRKFFCLLLVCSTYQLYGMESEPQDSCAICLEKIENKYDPKIVCGPCFFSQCSMQHFFEEDCLQKWLDNREDQASCPMCRGPLIAKNDYLFLNAIRRGELANVKKKHRQASDSVKNNYAPIIATHYGQLEVLRYFIEDLEQELDWDYFATLAATAQHPNVEMYLRTQKLLTLTIRNAVEANETEKLGQIIRRCSKNRLIQVFQESAQAGYIGSIQYLYETCSSLRKNAHATLTIAVAAGQLPVIRYFVENKKMTTGLDRLLELAVEMGHVPVVNYFLDEQHVSANACILLTQAANHGQLPIIEYLMQRQEILTILQAAVGTPIHSALNNVITVAVQKALHREHNEIVYYFFQNHFGNISNLLTEIIRNNNFQVIQHLTEQQLLDQKAMEFAAMQAIEYDKNNIATYLLRDNCSPQKVFLNALVPHRKKMTEFLTQHYNAQVNLPECLFHAAESGQMEIIPTIILYQNEPDDLVKASLLAAKNGHRDIVQLFTEEYQVQSAIDDTILLADQNGSRDVVEYLINRQEIPPDILQQTLLQAIIQGRNALTISIITTLINRDIDVRLEHLLALALTTKHTDIIVAITRFIEQRNASQHQPVNPTQLILQTMATDNVEILHSLISRYRSQVNLPNLLHIAVRKGCLKVVRFFLEKLYVDCDFNELLRWAHRYDQEAIEQYLIEYHQRKLNLHDFERWKESLAALDQ